MEKANELGSFKRLMEYNKPTLFFMTGLIGSVSNGTVMPIFGGFFLSKVLSLLSIPLKMLPMLFPEKAQMDPKDILEEEMNFYCMCMGLMGVMSFIAIFASKYSFSILGENVTLGIRCVLYEHILEKNIGWFDLRENSAGVLTSSMASDTSIINGVGGESIGP